MNCKICSSSVDVKFSAEIMNKYNVNYFYCNNCGFLSTEEPYWLDEVYSTPISKFDTGHIQRNIVISRKLTVLLTLFFNRGKKFVDYAGGNGILVRMMRDIGFNYFWTDKYANNLFASGFELDSDCLEEVGAITAIECFEHFVDPIKEIESLLQISKNIIFTTELLPSKVPKPNDWWYYTLERGGHISFFSKKTFEYIANKYGLYYSHFDGVHVLTEKSYITDSKLKVLYLSKFCLFYSRFLKLYKSKTGEDNQSIRARFRKEKTNG